MTRTLKTERVADSREPGEVAVDSRAATLGGVGHSRTVLFHSMLSSSSSPSSLKHNTVTRGALQDIHHSHRGRSRTYTTVTRGRSMTYTTQSPGGAPGHTPQSPGGAPGHTPQSPGGATGHIPQSPGGAPGHTPQSPGGAPGHTPHSHRGALQTYTTQ